MGKIKYLRKIEEFMKKSIVFSNKDINKLIGNSNYTNLALHNLLKQGKINRLTKGCYSRFNDPILIAYCIKPSYIGLENALSLHGLWEQESNVVLLTPRRVRTGKRLILGGNVIIKQIKNEHFFGFDYIDYYDFKMPISDIEKTFIDLLYYKRYVDNRLLNEFKKRINKKKLKSYLRNYSKEFSSKIIAMVA